MRTDRPATFSSAIWYFALQLGQRNFIQRSAGRTMAFWLFGEKRRISEGTEPRKERAPSLARASKMARFKKNAATGESGRNAGQEPRLTKD